MNRPLFYQRRGRRLTLRIVALLLLSVVAIGLLALGAFAPDGVLQAQEPVLPLETPDAESGLSTYEARCANCHGPQGAGDGEMAPQLPMPPASFAAPDYRRTAQPSELYLAITNGSLEAGMPPFGPASSNPIPEDERWNLVAAIYSLSTPPEAVESGAVLYEENCAACHGPEGRGDGPETAALETAPPDLTDLSYWFNRSNEMVFADLQSTEVAAHEYQLMEDELWDVVDYTRTFSYAYIDPNAPAEPIAAATISGAVTLGDSTEAITAGEVTLRAFTPEIREAMTMTTTLDAEGTYSFALSDVPPEWVYLTTIEYEDLSFSSNPGRLERANPELELPVTVYGKTTEADAVSIEQIHMILEVADDRLLVSEIYIFNNEGSAVYVGDTGNTDDGTIEVVLPTGAENPVFQRSFGSFENFLPADEMIQTDRGWADTLPLRPGARAMNLLVNYELPYEEGMRVAHPVFYETRNASVILPDAGVRLDDDAWVAQQPQQMGGTQTLLSYARPGLEAGDALSFTLTGRPLPAGSVGGVGGALTGMDSTLQWVLGGVALLAVGAVGFVLVRRWQAPDLEDNPQQLLQAIAALDDAYDSGQIDQQTYERQRAAYVSELAAMWQRDGTAQSGD